MVLTMHTGRYAWEFFFFFLVVFRWKGMVGWTKPIDPPASWDDEKIKAANFNSWALNTLFSVMTKEEFKKISSTESAKKAWTILQNTFEGTKVVKDSKFQRIPYTCNCLIID